MTNAARAGDIGSSAARLIRANRRRRSGFTLVEMVVAVLLLAIGVVAATICISSATKATSIANEYTTAALLAQQRFATLEASPDQIVAGQQQGSFAPDQPGFNWDQNIEVTNIPQVYKVTIAIQWQTGVVPRSAQFISYELIPPTS